MAPPLPWLWPSSWTMFNLSFRPNCFCRQSHFAFLASKHFLQNLVWDARTACLWPSLYALRVPLARSFFRSSSFSSSSLRPTTPKNLSFDSIMCFLHAWLSRRARIPTESPTLSDLYLKWF